MKKFIIIIILILLGFGGYVAYVELTKDKTPPLTPEVTKAEITKYIVYGTHLNIEGSLTVDNLEYDDIDLVLYNKDKKKKKKESPEKKFTTIKITPDKEMNTVSFKLSDLINEGLYLDDITQGKYYLFIRTTHKTTNDKNEEEISYKYYSLDNKTTYPETTYYTLSKYNNKISINSNNDYQTLMFDVTENKDAEIYDVVIDPGHGGMDPGAVVNGKKETDYTMDMALSLKESLEKLGLKVKLTWDENTITNNKVINYYGKGGRAQISHEVYAKYVFSLHLNSSAPSVHGVEVYTPSNINYNFAKELVKKITENTTLTYSNKSTYRVFSGVYTHNFTEKEIEASAEEARNKNRTPYDITTSSSYLYMIRETGGIMTGAYVDDRNEEQKGNDYYNSNIGAEAYLLEMCYLSNSKDMEILDQEKDKYISAISDTINDILLKKV